MKREQRIPAKVSRRGSAHDGLMKIVGLCASLALASGANAQFEGIIETRNSTLDELGRPQQFVMTMWIKKDMIKIETSGTASPGATMIYRTDLRKIWMLNPEEKTYFEVPQDQKPDEMVAPGGTTEKYSIKKTGKTKTIAGYSCEEFLIKREGEETRLWGTRKLGHVVGAITRALGQEHADVAEGAVNEVMKMGIYPMMSTTKIDGEVVDSQEVTRVEQRSLDPALFALPSGYTKQKTVDMMQGIQHEKK